MTDLIGRPERNLIGRPTRDLIGWVDFAAVLGIYCTVVVIARPQIIFRWVANGRSDSHVGFRGDAWYILYSSLCPPVE